MKLSRFEKASSLLDTPLPDLEFRSVQSDSRLVGKGDLFAVVQGTDDDGRRYIDQALRAGAAALLVDRTLDLPPYPVPALRTGDVRGAMAELACAANDGAGRRMDLFAVTGTNGKTTTAWVLAELLKAAGRKPGLQTTVAVEFAGRTRASARTTPGSCELHNLLGEMFRAGCDSAVMEASSHALDQRRVAALRFTGAAFTNLTEDHLDYHKTMERYFEAKQKLFRQMADENPDGTAVCLLDAPYGETMADFCKRLKLHVVCAGIGRIPGATLRAESVELAPDGSRFRLVAEGAGEDTVTTLLAGRYNISNLLCAAGLALSAGVPFETVCQTLGRVQPRWGRLERIATPLPCSVYVDYAHTDDALRKVLTAAREMTEKRLFVVFGCGGDRDRAKRPLMGRACAECADRLVVTSDNPRSENPLAIIDEILAGIPKTAECAVEPDRRVAIRLALQEAGAGDLVVVAGKGHETTQTIAGVAYPFDDREVVREEAGKIIADRC
ncbi:MAG: UDP-N-acetylmuramoyl-L-alanyl-D-glutamate--2,6-diaminopimelate ligase [Kiritimatiellae bacterium]|nr:UDP-N-acetylmuramoyl-L-alanyl-D-glutamate--2,6-diaminopimelate ligase [Kiritimatiellia bacterium]